MIGRITFTEYRIGYLILSYLDVESKAKVKAKVQILVQYCYFSYDTHCFRVILWKNKIFYRHRHLHLTSGSKSKCFSNFVVTYYQIQSWFWSSY